ncbi:hypothetical protein Amet_0275 [Alkaliphilus metalliredigens QYMF]|uniref:Uncharacterized protein n=1 Tax=Alkaliphilus metalliredigens (strain QYMF) TaxID=293826 RepID=A6TJZ0_ALKMQ|nr:hypothetical protein [Alkaliphilus metalliredigens]ABR46508.1 hypothetical protein Amet_0275 [Alkaliphilus metalliredigens QYMF]
MSIEEVEKVLGKPQEGSIDTTGETEDYILYNIKGRQVLFIIEEGRVVVSIIKA